MRIKCIEHNKTQITLTARNEAVSKRKNTSQTATSVRVFYSKHENKMYPEPQTRLRQAQTDSNLQTITVIASEEQTKQSLHC